MRYLAFTILFLSCFTVKAQINFNGNMEQLDKNGSPAGWDLTFDHINTYEVKLDSLVKKQGKYALSLTRGNSKATYGAIDFPINTRLHGKTLILAGFIKTENVKTGNAGLWLRVDGENKRMISFDTMDKNGIKGTTDWKECMVQVPYDEGEAVSIHAGVFLTGDGKIWLDSVRLYLDETPIDKAPLATTPNYQALKDTAFARSSGLSSITVNEQNIKRLVLLGQLWGFLKYHHPAIAKGDYNWDAQLFRILPQVLKCRTDKQVSAVLEKWVDGLGKPGLCTNCTPVGQVKNVMIKPDYGSLFSNKVFSASLTGKLRFILVNSNNSTNYYVDRTDTRSIFKHEQTYNDVKYPDAGLRLLALYRYWNMIQYFSPNRNLITQGWDKMLAAYIPQLIRAHSQLAYIKTMVKLICSTHDTHAFIANPVYDDYLGNYRMPLQAKFIEGKLVVTGYYKDTLQVKENFKVGDVIKSINGIAVDMLVKKYLPVSSASNTAAALRDMPGIYLLRSKNPRFKINLARGSRTITINQQALEKDKINFFGFDSNPNPASPSCYLINKQMGYIFPGRYKSGDLDSIKKQFERTKGIIVDLRCYPATDDVLADLSNFIKPDSSAFARVSYTSVNRPGLFVYDFSYTGNRTHNYYKGKVVVIVNAVTQSFAEFETMVLQSAPNVTVIGSTTAGADGNITDVPLPGITTWLSGLGILYPDGTNAQGAGVKINYIIKPTIKGIKAGRDELLEKAKQIIVENK